MNKKKALFFVSIIIFGVFMFIYGGYDDSPGGQLLGLVMIIIGIIRLKYLWKK